MKISASLPTGVAALLFEAARRHRLLESDMMSHLEELGFSEVILPVVDYLRPYERLISERSRSELYRFVDRDGELLSLRADFTPMLARLLAPRMASLDLPLRLSYRGDVLRYQEERAGRQREFYQLGAEVLGLAGEDGEAEALERFLELLAIGERRRLVVVLGFAGALDRLLEDRAGGNGPRELVDAIVRRERRHARRASPELLQVVENGVPEDGATLGEVAAGRLERLVGLRRRLSRRFPAIDMRIDLAEFADQVTSKALLAEIGARAYYDGLVFRAFAGAAAEPVGGGGRYDRLFRALGAGVTAAGFAFSLDRLLAPTGVGDRAGSENGRDGEGSR
ncbi:MAG: ATP phosphoribosyltransferase regulatory subunit [Holophagales bacterium]|nr:ATP phosphoribosyltransferase regulatory subunit [Holophagales bacterium]